LFVLVLLAHRPAHPAYCGHRSPDGRVDGQQLREAFPWDEAPFYLLHDDRDHAFDPLGVTGKAMGIEECAPHHARLGKMQLSSDSFDPRVASVSIT
jgi:hypothetical protein